MLIMNEYGSAIGMNCDCLMFSHHVTSYGQKNSYGAMLYMYVHIINVY